MFCETRGARTLAIALILLASPRVIAAPLNTPSAPKAPPAPNTSTVDQDKRVEAIAHLDKGSSLYDTGNWAAALAEFFEARKLYPLRSATHNAGVCLEKLQRYDEALDMMETLLREFGDKMPADEKDKAQRRVARLRGLVGTIEVEVAEPGAAITIDGKTRGEYPLLAPLRVAAGSHVVRVYKEGFEPFEAHLDVAGGKTARVEGVMRALVASGHLTIAERSGKVLDVVLDGIIVGKTPWEGRVAIGDHVIALRGEGELGTQPIAVPVRLNQVNALTLSAEWLDALVRIEPVPVTASVAIDSISVGRGIWADRLKSGPHTIEITADGFLAEAQEVNLTSGKLRVLPVRLQRDPKSPFWHAQRQKPRFLVELAAGVPLLPTFGGDVVGACIKSCTKLVGVGVQGVVHGGYELGSGFGYGLLAGYLIAWQGISARETGLSVHDGPDGSVQASGSADDLLEFDGVLAGAWVGYTFGERVPIHLRLDLGALLGSASDALSFKGRGQALNDSHASGPYSVRVFERHTATFFYAAPEVRMALPLGRRVELSAGVSVPLLIGLTQAQSAQISRSHYGFTDAEPDALTGAVVVAIVPGVGVRYDF